MKTEVMKLNSITIFPTNIVRKMFNFRSFHFRLTLSLSLSVLFVFVRPLINWTTWKIQLAHGWANKRAVELTEKTMVECVYRGKKGTTTGRKMCSTKSCVMSRIFQSTCLKYARINRIYIQGELSMHVYGVWRIETTTTKITHNLWDF